MAKPMHAVRGKNAARGNYSVFTYIAVLFLSVIMLILLSYFSHPGAGTSAAELTEPVGVQTQIRA